MSGPKNIVLIPAWKRPEFLAACLKYITLSRGWKANHYLIAIDNHSFAGGKYDPEVLSIANQFPGEKTIKIRPPDGIRSNTRNLMEGYREAVKLGNEIGSELVYMIETDIFIARDFFDFHEAVHRDHRPFFVSACRNQNNKAALSLAQDPTAIHAFGKYQSLGNSFRVAELGRVVRHSRPEFYANMPNYIRTAFPGSKFPKGMWTEQDGLINRIMEEGKLSGLFPNVPRAYHAGFTGYNRTGRELPRSMSLTERTAALMTMSESEMNERASNPQFKDITMCDLLGHDAKAFHIAKPNAVPN